MKKVLDARQSMNVNTLPKLWIDTMVASTIGPNMSLYSLSDPEGEKRIEIVHQMIHDTLTKAWESLHNRADFSHENFVHTSQSAILNIWSDFITARMEWCLINGMPEATKIIKPN